jgi:hypothetical protein
LRIVSEGGFERAAEMGGASETAVLGDIGNRHFCPDQKLPGRLKPEFAQIVRGRPPGLGTEDAGEMFA